MRLLPPEEWPKLVGTLLHPSWQAFDPVTLVVVVERGTEIVGCTALLPVWHAEGTWIAPAHRGKATVLRRLIGAWKTVCREHGIREVLMMTRSDQNAQMVKKFGKWTQLACDHFAVVLE